MTTMNAEGKRSLPWWIVLLEGILRRISDYFFSSTWCHANFSGSGPWLLLVDRGHLAHGQHLH